MPIYMFQESYTSEAWAVQIRNPQNRMEVARRLIEAQGGKLLSAYYAFGEDDVVLIAELPDNVSAAAIALTVAGGGAAKALKTTVLMSVEEGLEAMRRAGGTGYRPPGS
ncbi:MAG: GYD domain-containing protein [Candidatus Rokubacteria bacterium]|nr:GYD domain-containing protein [Candidatus Rokubacteria bacterium]